MTRKDFEVFASIINAQVRVTYTATASQAIRLQTLRDVAAQACATFVHHNPRFNVAKFNQACGLVED